MMLTSDISERGRVASKLSVAFTSFPKEPVITAFLGKPADTALPQGRKRIPAVLMSFDSTKPFSGYIPAPGLGPGSGETGHAYLW